MRNWQVEGPNHKIKVKFVTAKTINKHAYVNGIKSAVRGLCVFKDNQIYILKGLSIEETIHTLLHEVVHSASFQLENTTDDEAKTDALASWMIRLFNVTSFEGLLK